MRNGSDAVADHHPPADPPADPHYGTAGSLALALALVLAFQDAAGALFLGFAYAFPFAFPLTVLEGSVSTDTCSCTFATKLASTFSKVCRLAEVVMTLTM